MCFKSRTENYPYALNTDNVGGMIPTRLQINKKDPAKGRGVQIRKGAIGNTNGHVPG